MSNNLKLVGESVPNPTTLLFVGDKTFEWEPIAIISVSFENTRNYTTLGADITGRSIGVTVFEICKGVKFRLQV